MFKKLVKLFASVKIAVVILLALATLIAAGTIVESKYNAQAAAKIVYNTWMMYTVMITLALTLIAVMIDRWPWKKRHIPFLLAHVGILILQLGAVITANYGLDGNMRFGIGESNRFVTVPNTELQIWSSFDGDNYSKILEKEVDFFVDSPKEKPFHIDLAEGPFLIDDYMPYAIPSRKIVLSPEKVKTGSAVRFQVQNDRVNVNEWLFQKKPTTEASQAMGLARFVLGRIPPNPLPENALYMQAEGPDKVQYLLTYKDEKRKPLRGSLKEGDSFDTGWMGLKFHLLRYFQNAEESYEFKALERPTDLTTSAIQINFQGKKNWVQLNDVFKLFTPQGVYIVTYGSKRIDLGFKLDLKNFEIGRDPGSNKAATYQSLVATPDGKETLIAMNEPLKYQGLTFYQASFQEGPDGAPIASILSVNRDPGRWLKYLGSLILSLGVVWLFYNKRKAARAQAPTKEVV
jgi:hypothetical protein